MVRFKGPDHGFYHYRCYGESFLVLADTLARTIIAPQELPVGAITALCGAPLLLPTAQATAFVLGLTTQ